MNKEPYKVIIAGTRTFDNYPLLCSFCDKCLSQKELTNDIVIISGAAKGADTLGEHYARMKGFAVESHPADWEKHGRAAGPIRNAEMADTADALIAFWDGQSRGTANMIETARKKSLKIRICNYNLK